MSPLKQKIIVWTYQKPNGMGFQPWIFVGVAAMAFARLTRDRPQKTSVGCSRTVVVIWVGYVISLEGILFPQLRLIFLLHMLEVVLSKLLFKCLKWYYSINTTLFQISTANKMRASTERTYGKRDLRNDNKQSNFHADTISTYSNLMTFFFCFSFLQLDEGWYCWWKKSGQPVGMVKNSHLQRVLWIPGGFLAGSSDHQQYHLVTWADI